MRSYTIWYTNLEWHKQDPGHPILKKLVGENLAKVHLWNYMLIQLSLILQHCVWRILWNALLHCLVGITARLSISRSWFPWYKNILGLLSRIQICRWHSESKAQHDGEVLWGPSMGYEWRIYWKWTWIIYLLLYWGRSYNWDDDETIFSFWLSLWR